jgi:hypothetical protein
MPMTQTEQMQHLHALALTAFDACVRAVKLEVIDNYDDDQPALKIEDHFYIYPTSREVKVPGGVFRKPMWMLARCEMLPATAEEHRCWDCGTIACEPSQVEIIRAAVRAYMDETASAAMAEFNADDQRLDESFADDAVRFLRDIHAQDSEIA